MRLLRSSPAHLQILALDFIHKRNGSSLPRSCLLACVLLVSRDSFTVELLHMCLQNLKHAASYGNIFAPHGAPANAEGYPHLVTHKCASPSFTDHSIPARGDWTTYFIRGGKKDIKNFFSSLQMTWSLARSRPRLFFSRLYYTFSSNFDQSCFQSCRHLEASQILVGILLRSDDLVM